MLQPAATTYQLPHVPVCVRVPAPLQSQRSLLLDDGELEALGALLARWALPPTPAPGSSAGSDPEEPRINYDGLVQVGPKGCRQPL